MSWHRPAGTLQSPPDPLRVGPGEAGWEYSGLHVLSLQPGEKRSLRFDSEEVLIVPLSGSYRVRSEPLTADLAGREHVFDRSPTARTSAAASLPELESSTGGRSHRDRPGDAGGEAMYLTPGPRRWSCGRRPGEPPGSTACCRPR